MKTIKYNIRAFREVNNKDKIRNLYTAFYFISDMIIIVIYNIIMLPFIYYSVEKRLNINRYLAITIPLLVLIIVITIYNAYYLNYILPVSDAKIKYKFNLEIYNKAKNVDLIEYNNTKFYEVFSLLSNIGAEKLVETVNIIWWAISIVLLTLIYCSVIFYIAPIFNVLAVLSAILAYVLNLKISNIEYTYNIENNKIARKSAYYDRLYLLRRYSSDLRTSNLSSLLMNKIRITTDESQSIIKGYGNKLLKLNYLKKLIIFIATTTITTLYLSFQFIVKDKFELTISEIIVAQTVMMQLCNILSDIAVIYPKLKQNGMYLKDYYDFTNYKAKIDVNENGIIAQNKCNGIKIKNLYFQYDDNIPVLKNINMEIKPGEKIAIVGSNGAGKTSLIKLLLRLYLPTKGSIEMDGVPVEKYKLSTYRDRFGIAYQENNIYAVSVSENVLMDKYTPKMRKTVEMALRNSGVNQRISQSQLNIESIMTKEFDNEGIELSGGEAQKIALARVFAKNCGVVILDEPSSALDPISEYEMYRNIMNLSKNKTFIVISHRLSITRDVDRIYLLENGEILESGTHSELLELKGRYADMWKVQSEMYS